MVIVAGAELDTRLKSASASVRGRLPAGVIVTRYSMAGSSWSVEVKPRSRSVKKTRLFRTESWCYGLHAVGSGRCMSANPVDLRAGDGIRRVAGAEKPA